MHFNHLINSTNIYIFYNLFPLQVLLSLQDRKIKKKEALIMDHFYAKQDVRCFNYFIQMNLHNNSWRYYPFSHLFPLFWMQKQRLTEVK